MDENFAPYAPKTAVVDTITRYRDRGLPVPLTPQALETVGVATTMAPRTLQTLQFLGLLDGENNPTELFQRLKRASTDEYQGQLAEVVRGAYIRVFEIVDPAADGDIAIADAFRAFEPSKQRVKMISLFRGLCAEAGIMEQSRLRSTTRRMRVNGTKPGRKAQNAPENTSGPPARPPAREDSDVLTQDAMRSMYFKLLLKKAEANDGGDADLFARIERLVGLQPDEGENRGWTTAGSKPATPASPASQGER
jgi:hypothetical protein